MELNHDMQVAPVDNPTWHPYTNGHSEQTAAAGTNSLQDGEEQVATDERNRLGRLDRPSDRQASTMVRRARGVSVGAAPVTETANQANTATGGASSSSSNSQRVRGITLYVNDSEESRKTRELLGNAGVEFSVIESTRRTTPAVEWNNMTLAGLRGIRDMVRMMQRSQSIVSDTSRHSSPASTTSAP